MLICCLAGLLPVSAAEEKLFPDSYKIILCENSLTGIASGEMSVLSAYPAEKDGFLMLPVRYLLENLGYEVLWKNGKTQLLGEKTVEISENSEKITVDGDERLLSAPVFSSNGSLMISEEICEILGYKYKKNKDGVFVIYEGSYVGGYDSVLLKLQGVFISPDGVSFGSATPKNPVKNIASAMETAKLSAELYGKKYPVNVYVKGGSYRITETVYLDSTVFNSDIKGIKFLGYDGEAKFTGAAELDATKLKPVTDAFTLARIPKEGRGKVAYLDLNEAGLSGAFGVNQTSLPYVYVNDVMQIESRWPNSGFALMGNVPSAGYFTVPDNNVRNWVTQTEAYVSGFFSADYDMRTSSVSSVNGETKTVGLIGLSFAAGKTNTRYYIHNLLEEIDMPGEWFVDRKSGILYFYPPYSLKDAKLEITTLMDKNMFDLSNCNNVSFDKITFEKGGKGAIYMPNASNISITNCKFRFFQGTETIGGSGYYTANPGDNITIDGNEGWMLGRSFSSVSTGDVNTLKNGNSKITNNRIMCAGFVSSYDSVIKTGKNSPDRNASVGWTIANNLIQDSECSNAINPTGIDILTTKNECLNIAYNINDGGAIYVGRAATLYNNEVSYNYVHHLNKDYSYCALYNDDGYSGSYWHHNIAYDVRQLFIIGMGLDMRIENNLAVDAAYGYGVGSRMTWQNEHYYQDGILHTEVKDTLSKYPIYRSRFPQMAEAAKRNPYFAPWNSTVYGNVGINASAESTAYGTESVVEEINTYGAKTITDDNGKTIDVSGKHATKEGNPGYTYSDDYFEDPASQNWNLKADSEIAKNHPSLLKINMEEIGLSEGYENLLNLNKDFKLKAPYNGQTGVQPKEIIFSWDPVKGASKYRLVIATDPEMTNIVYDKTQASYLNNNLCTVTTLDLGTVYYWKVYAIGLARQDQFEVSSLGGPYSFKTAQKNEVNRENLKIAIDSLKSVLKEIEEGGYEYEEEFFTKADAVLKKAEEIHSKSTDQDERDKMEEEIYNLVNISPYYMIVEFKNPSFLYNPNADWELNSENASVTYNGTEVTLSSTAQERFEAYVESDTENSVLCMQVKQKMEGLTASDYTGYLYKVNKDKRSDYQLFVFKEWITEYQKNGLCIELPNFNADKDDDWQNVELGSIKCPGGVMTFVAVNGAVLWAGLDRSNTKVEKGGEFGVWRNRYDTKMRPMENVPEKTSLIKRIYENLENPQCEEHLAAMLKGMGTIIEMDNTLYNSLDKEKLAKNLYPYLEGGKVKINSSDISEYKELVWKYAILEGYNQSKSDFVLKNKVTHIYNDYVEIEKLDEDGRCFFEIMNNDFMDNYKAKVSEEAMGGECKSFEELRVRYARAIFKIAINGCSGGIYGGATSYMKKLITKENADYMGINIDAYFALDDTGKDTVNNYIGRNGVSQDRTVEEIVEEINEKAKSLR